MAFGKKFKKNNKQNNNEETPTVSTKEKHDKEEDNKPINYQDLYARVSADFQNYKRRVEKERASWIREAQADVLTPLLAVIDDLDRAIESCKKQQDGVSQEGILAGLELVYKKMTKTFIDLGVQEIDCSEKFSPEFHEALVQVESDDHVSGNIVQVMSKGYTFHGDVLRHAKVSVAK